LNARENEKENCQLSLRDISNFKCQRELIARLSVVYIFSLHIVSTRSMYLCAITQYKLS